MTGVVGSLRLTGPGGGEGPGAGAGAGAGFRVLLPGVWLGLSRVVTGVVFSHFVVELFPGSMVLVQPGASLRAGWFEAFDRWDALTYLTLARSGYSASTPQLKGSFFPGFPLAVDAVHWGTFGLVGYLEAGCLVSWASFIAASGLLFLLVSRRFGAGVALAATGLFCWFPTSVFFLAPYSEALFVLLILVALWLLERERFLAAAVVAAYGSATSPLAIGLGAAIVVGALVAGRGVRRAVGYGVVSGTGAVAFLVYLWARFGSPVVFWTEQRRWHRMTVFPLWGVVRNAVSIRQLLDSRGPVVPGTNPLSTNVVVVWVVDDVVLVAAAVVVATLGVAAYRGFRGTGGSDVGGEVGAGMPLAWVVLLGVMVLIVASTVVRLDTVYVSTESDARLLSVAVPLYPALVLLVRRWLAPVVLGLAASVTAALLFQVLFTLYSWMT